MLGVIEAWIVSWSERYSVECCAYRASRVRMVLPPIAKAVDVYESVGSRAIAWRNQSVLGTSAITNATAILGVISNHCNFLRCIAGTQMVSDDEEKWDSQNESDQHWRPLEPEQEHGAVHDTRLGDELHRETSGDRAQLAIGRAASSPRVRRVPTSKERLHSRVGSHRDHTKIWRRA